jgi:hypothetical protein
MNRTGELPAVRDWKKVLWWTLGIAAGIAAVLAGLSALLRVIYLVGVSYGLGLGVLAFFLAQLAMRVEYGEPSGAIAGENAFAFLLRGADRYPQCLLMVLLGIGTMIGTVTVAILAGTAGFSTAEGSNRDPGPVADGKPGPTGERSGGPAPAEDQGSAEPGLRASWSFDEGKGDKAYDSGPHRLEATLHGCQWVPGVRGTALQFNGTSDYLELSSSKVLNFADKAPFTIAAWVKTSRDKGYILSFRHQPDTCDLVNVFLNGGKLAVWVRHQGDVLIPDTTTTTAPIHDGQWHHFAITRNTGGEVTLYLDGTANARLTSPARARGKLVTNLRSLGVEALNMDGKNAFVDRSRLEGCLDELRIYGEVLSETDIRKLASQN